MNWRNIKLVWMREVRDQLRDRRTLFMVAVLPLFMYPLMGMSIFQLSQFMRQHTAQVAVAGAQQLADVEGAPPLIEDGRFAPELFPTPEQAELLDVRLAEEGDGLTRELRTQLAAGEVDAVVVFPADFAERLRALREQTRRLGAGRGDAEGDLVVPQPSVIHNGAREASQVANLRVQHVLDTWRRRVTEKNLADSRVPSSIAQPFGIQTQDIATRVQQRAGMWAKLLPFVVFVWALTGAFYPAVDLCAGEKERGTLETLLASPAQRSEIVWGKLLTVVCFSIVTALLNLASLGATGHFMLGQLTSATGGPVAGLGMPPLFSLVWLVVALPPIAALFSALSLACASFARSTKEGQYYFMPLFMVALPLMLLPMSPGVELNLGNSLIPLMGVVLLLRALIEGQHVEALRYAVPVTLMTGACCLLAARWAVYQFNQESVLFREGERFDLGHWLRKLVREPREMPTTAMAVVCVALIFVLQFFANTAVAGLTPESPGFGYLTAVVLISQACVLAPAVLMAVFLVRRHAGALFGARRPTVAMLMVGVLMAVAAHPLGLELIQAIDYAYPINDSLKVQNQEVAKLLQTGGPWLAVLLIGVLPAVCEEMTFRGFVLSGLRKSASTPWAVALTAVAFGAVHSVFQQSLAAAGVGLLVGYLAVRAGSIWPCIAFHATYNSLIALSAFYAEWISETLNKTGWRSLLTVDTTTGEVTGYSLAVVSTSTAVLVALVVLIERARQRTGAMTHPAEIPSVPVTPQYPIDRGQGLDRAAETRTG